jgi:hypothetical protein
MLAPVFPTLVIAGALVWKGRKWLAIPAVCVLAVMMQRSVDVVRTAWRDGPGGASYTNYNSPRWSASPTLQWSSAHLGPGLTFASSPGALFLHAGLEARPMPRKHARRSPGVPVDDLDAIAQEIAHAGGAYLVVLNGDIPEHAFTLAELRGRLALQPVAALPDGAVYRVTSPPARQAPRPVPAAAGRTPSPAPRSAP